MKYGRIHCYVFMELWPQSETIYRMQVWTLSGKVLKFADSSRIRKSLHKCERSIKLFNTLSASIASYRNESTDFRGQYWHLMG